MTAVAYIMPQWWGFADTVTGLQDYANAHQWRLNHYLDSHELIESLSSQSALWRARAQGGIVYGTPRWNALKHAPLPLVNVGYAGFGPQLPLVLIHDEGTGRLAAQYFLERGLRHFAFFGYCDLVFSKARQKGYTAALKKRKIAPQIHLVPSAFASQSDPPVPFDGSVLPDMAALSQWIEALPKPVGLFTCHDFLGRCAIDACTDRQIKVPEQVAILGVNNDKWNCELSDPPLSSVAHPMQRIGYEAARLLDKLMQGGRPPHRPLLVPPLGIVERRSTAILDLWEADEEVVAAFHYIRDNLPRGMGVDDVAEHLLISRRTLERRFRKHLGRSVLDEIHRATLGRAKELLATTHLSIEEVATQCGFEYQPQFSTFFKEQTGETPTAYRRQLQRGE